MLENRGQVAPRNLKLSDFYKYIGFTFVALVGIVAIFFLGKIVWHEATKERPHFNTGQIQQRDYEPAHTDYVPQQQYVGEDCYYNSSSKSESCTPQYRTIIVPEYVPDAWSIRIVNCHVKHKDGSEWTNKDGSMKCFHKWIDVDETTYNSVAVGQRWNG